MKTLTWEEAAEWARTAGISAAVNRSVNEYVINGEKQSIAQITKTICFPGEEPANRLTIPLPKLPYQVSYLANDLLPYENFEFQPCLLWVTDWGIWSETSERVAKKLMHSFRATGGETKSLIEAPAHLCNSTEVAEAQTILTIAIVFGWDCYVIPEHGKYYAFNSHHEYIQVVSSNPETHGRFSSYLKRWYSEETS